MQTHLFKHTRVCVWLPQKPYNRYVEFKHH